jgi:hypothetical protein
MNAPIDIWDEPERPQTLADISFAPTSINFVEFPDDIEPVAFQANRAAMEANGARELQELEALNQQTSTYPTMGCTTGPMSPVYQGGPACDVAAMQERSHGITAYTNGKPLLTQFNDERASMCAHMEVVGDTPIATYSQPADEGPVLKKPRMRHITTRMANSVRGAMYDLQHFNELPPARSGQSPSEVAMFALTRDNRTPYLLLVLIFALVVSAALMGVRSYASKK